MTRRDPSCSCIQFSSDYCESCFMSLSMKPEFISPVVEHEALICLQLVMELASFQTCPLQPLNVGLVGSALLA